MLVAYVILTTLTISLTLVHVASDDGCKGKTLQFVLFGHRLQEDRWNTSYLLDSYSCNTPRNWTIYFHQNITETGNAKHLQLRGYFTDDTHSTDINETQSSSDQETHSCDAVQSLSSSVKGSNENNSSFMRIVSRSEWNARTPTKTPKILTHPVEVVDIYDSGSGYDCSKEKDCQNSMRRLQESVMSSYGDIFGNFHVGGDGRIYEGAGWDHSFDGHMNLKFLNNSNPPSPKELASMGYLVREGIKLGKISSDYRFIGSRSGPTKEWVEWANNI